MKNEFDLSFNFKLIIHFALGRKWEYDSKIEHPSPKHGYHHKGHNFHSDKGKGWVNSYDSGAKHHGKHYEEHKPIIPIHHEIPIHLPVHLPHIPPVHTIPNIPELSKLEIESGQDYEPPQHYEQKHYEPPQHYPIHKHVIHYEPKHEEPKKDNLDININVDGIIDDIQKDLKKTTNSENYVS